MTDLDPRAKLATELAQLQETLKGLAGKNYLWMTSEERQQRDRITLRIGELEGKLKAGSQLDLFGSEA